MTPARLSSTLPNKKYDFKKRAHTYSEIDDLQSDSVVQLRPEKDPPYEEAWENNPIPDKLPIKPAVPKEKRPDSAVQVPRSLSFPKGLESKSKSLPRGGSLDGMSGNTRLWKYWPCYAKRILGSCGLWVFKSGIAVTQQCQRCGYSSVLFIVLANAQALVKLCGCVGSPELSQFVYVILKYPLYMAWPLYWQFFVCWDMKLIRHQDIQQKVKHHTWWRPKIGMKTVLKVRFE